LPVHVRRKIAVVDITGGQGHTEVDGLLARQWRGRGHGEGDAAQIVIGMLYGKGDDMRNRRRWRDP